jgi:anthranilate synthase/indole-3-glycerol phosphate synthase/phosphoribosylanthranilate isomerase
VADGAILDRIVAQRRRDVDAAKAAVPEAELRARVAVAPAAIDFTPRLEAAGPVALIAEIKRASPSKGDIAPGIDAARQATVYAAAGAAGISVLTEPAWFKGSLEDMLAARLAVDHLGDERPGILRKDFIVDPYQLLEAAVYGADAALLIVACLDDATLKELIQECQQLDMEALVEVNNAREAERALEAGATFIGINNRDLRTFEVDTGTTERVAGAVPPAVMLAALSGVASRADVERFAQAGARAVLVGEALMVAADPGEKIREMLGR